MDEKKSKNKNKLTIEYNEKNSTLIGTRPLEVVDPATGQVLEMIQTTKLRYGSKHFWKCYLNEFIEVMESLSGKQFDVFLYIVKHTKQSDNKYIGTYEKIIKGSKCSRQIVAKTMKNLQDCDFIRKIQNGVWMVNPYILMKGDGQKQVILRKEYESVNPAEEETKKENGTDADTENTTNTDTKATTKSVTDTADA